MINFFQEMEDKCLFLRDGWKVKPDRMTDEEKVEILLSRNNGAPRWSSIMVGGFTPVPKDDKTIVWTEPAE
jgi:hypothetical protein